MTGDIPDSEASRTPEMIGAPEVVRWPIRIARGSMANPDKKICEDSSCVSRDGQLSAVVDGVGGASGAAAASRGVAEVFGTRDAGLVEIISEAHNKLKNDPKMGQACVAAAEISEDGRTLTYAHVGDSRVYIYNTLSGKLKCLTVDDKPGDWGMERQEELAEAKSLPEGSERIAKALGTLSDPAIESQTYDLIPGDVVLLSTDGLHNNLKDSKIATILGGLRNGNYSLEEVKENLIRSAYETSLMGTGRAKPDDITVVLAQVEAAVEPNVAARPTEARDLKVKRSDGNVDHGWHIDNIDENGGIAVVKKDAGNGTVLSKKIPLAEIVSLNMPETYGRVTQAQTKAELYEIIDKLGGIQGSQKFYTPDELKELIVNGDVNQIPRTLGLRDAVQRIIN